MNSVRLLVCALVLGASPTASAASGCATEDPDDPPVSVDVPVMVLSVVADKPRYRPRERVVVRIGARTGHPEGPKVAEAKVKVELYDGAVLVRTLRGETGEGGDVALAMLMPRVLRSGKLTARVVAEKELVPHYDCRRALAYQHGERVVDPLARRA